MRNGAKRLLSTFMRVSKRGILAGSTIALLTSSALAGNVSNLSLKKVGEHLLAASKTSILFQKGKAIGPIRSYLLGKNRLILMGEEASAGFREDTFSPRKAMLTSYIADSILPNIDREMVVKKLDMKARKPEKFWKLPVGESEKRLIFYEVHFDARPKPREGKK
ncbi:MAG: hypothetical protein ABH863_05630 [Candidatus Micrarchaeota archaeon]